LLKSHKNQRKLLCWFLSKILCWLKKGLICRNKNKISTIKTLCNQIKLSIDQLITKENLEAAVTFLIKWIWTTYSKRKKYPHYDQKQQALSLWERKFPRLRMILPRKKLEYKYPNSQLIESTLSIKTLLMINHQIIIKCISNSTNCKKEKCLDLLKLKPMLRAMLKPAVFWQVFIKEIKI
jgi:hypothetical protein